MGVSREGTVFGGALLVSGSAIGGGMLALPILTAAGGFWPAVLVYTLCWLFMMTTGLLLMELFLWSPQEVNIISMARMTLGLGGEIAAWLLYLFLFYSLLVAYTSCGGGLVLDLLSAFGFSPPPWVGPLIFVLLLAPFVGVGAKAVDRINTLFMVGLFLSFCFFLAVGARHVTFSWLARTEWRAALLATPVVFTSFGFQGIVPTLTNYLGRDPRRVQRAIVIGTLLPLLAYILWEGLILGVVPPQALERARLLGLSAVSPLREVVATPWLFSIGAFFAFFAIVTSFLGVALGLLDFLADGLKVKKTAGGRIGLAFLIFLPPLLFALVDPTIFLCALHYAGGIGCALLLGLLPIVMVWRGRYGQHRLSSGYTLFGGRPLLSALLLFILLELLLMWGIV